MTPRALALTRAFMTHEQERHGVTDNQPPPGCMDDVARRYDELRLLGVDATENAVVLTLAAMVLLHRELAKGNPVTLTMGDIDAFENAAAAGGGVQPTLGDDGQILLNPIKPRFDA